MKNEKKKVKEKNEKKLIRNEQRIGDELIGVKKNFFLRLTEKMKGG